VGLRAREKDQQVTRFHFQMLYHAHIVVGG